MRSSNTHFLRGFPIFLSKYNSYFTSTNYSVIKLLLSLCCIFTMSVFHKSKATRLTSVIVSRKVNILDRTIAFKWTPKIFRSCIKREITNE
uniref:Transmembrane protein n=1 Tax=Medicago truncatula TaxID=3880 RepID=I3TAS8_MEDTR|nr:unknown [Medicago truncatula]